MAAIGGVWGGVYGVQLGGRDGGVRLMRLMRLKTGWSVRRSCSYGYPALGTDDTVAPPPLNGKAGQVFLYSPLPIPQLPRCSKKGSNSVCICLK